MQRNSDISGPSGVRITDKHRVSEHTHRSSNGWSVGLQRIYSVVVNVVGWRILVETLSTHSQKGTVHTILPLCNFVVGHLLESLPPSCPLFT